MEKQKFKKIVAFKEKKEVIEDLENGFVSEESILEKYKIIPKTLRDWKKQVLQPTSGHLSRLKISDADKRKAAREVRSGLLTVTQAMIKYGCRQRTSIFNWMKQFSDDISDTTPLNMAKSEKESQDASELQKRCKELEDALKLAQLKVASLETLIDVAEKELHIDIRKKPGTKQSK